MSVSYFRSAHGRPPRAGRDPILCASDALAVFALQISRPLVFETLAVFLDGNACGTSLITISGTEDADSVVPIVDTLSISGARSDVVSGLVIATVRPGTASLPGDDERWTRVAAVAEENGLVLIDWLIIGRAGTHCPREQLGMPSRWASAR